MMVDTHEGRGRLRRLIGPGVALAALIALVVAMAALSACGSAGSEDGANGGTPTAGASKTAQMSPTGVSEGKKTPIPVSPGAELTLSDLAARGAGLPPRGAFTGERLLIPKIGVDAPLTYRLVPSDGKMQNPNGPWDVAYYDFANHDGLGGLPGVGGNVVVAGHVDYVNVGPAVFWSLDTLVAGDVVQVRLAGGAMVEYEVVFNKTINAAQGDWSSIVAGTAEESMTLITCAGNFANGAYDMRQIVWARRIA